MKREVKPGYENIYNDALKQLTELDNQCALEAKKYAEEINEKYASKRDELTKILMIASIEVHEETRAQYPIPEPDKSEEENEVKKEDKNEEEKSSVPEPSPETQPDPVQEKPQPLFGV